MSSVGRTIQIIILVAALGLSWNIKITNPDFPSPGEGRVPEAGEVATTSILAVGDILLSRHVGAQIDKANNPNLPFQNLQSILSGADITFGNLECPLSDSNIPIREGLVFRCLTKYVPGLSFAGFDVLSTANNHAMDQGLDNLEFTIDYLKSQNIIPVGTTDSVSNSIELDTSIEKNGIVFGFLAYSYSAFNDGKSTSHPQIATLPPLSPPFHRFDSAQGDPEQRRMGQGGGEEGVLQSAISNLKSNGAAIVIVSMHAGTEYTKKPTQAQIDFARAAIDAGADIVIGHHPHWIQEIEVYTPTIQLSPGEGRVPRAEPRGREVKPRQGIIFYSLGNFVFDQEWSRETKEGMMVVLSFEAHELKSAKLMPVIIESFCCPRLADEEEKKAILKKINLESDTINF